MEVENEMKSSGAGDFPVVHMAGNVYTILLRGIQTAGAYAAIDMIVPPQGGPNPHSHTDIQETFYVLEGEVEVKNELEIYTARKGDMIVIPLGGLIHCFKNKTDQVAHLLCVVVPSGLEKFFLEIGDHPAFSSERSGTEPTEKEKVEINEIAIKYGQTLYPPDFLEKPGS